MKKEDVKKHVKRYKEMQKITEDGMDIEDFSEEVEYLLSIIEQQQKIIKESRDKAQILASHCAYCADANRSLDVYTTFEKSQAIFEILDKPIQGE